MPGDRTKLIAVILKSLALVALGPLAVLAHEGPPFPILMDKPAGEYVISVWADPDIGDAQFYIIVESPQGGPPAEVPEVSMWTEPVSGRLQRVSYETKRQSVRNQVEFEARPYFDQRDQWTVGFQITPPGGTLHELTTEVESTPPGYGLVDFAIYLFPFALLGGFWVLAMVRRSRLRQEMLREEGDGVSDSEDAPAVHAMDFRKGEHP